MRTVRIPPAEAPTEPVTLAEAKAAIRVTHSLEDDFISSLIVAGREYAEAETRLSLVPSLWESSLDEFPCSYWGGYAIELPFPPLLEVVEVRYRDADGDWVVVDDADYEVDADASPAVILPVDSWPAPKVGRGNVRVRYRAGYGDGSVVDVDPLQIPEGIKTQILVYVAHRFVNRAGDEIPDAVRLGLYPYRYDL